jgi:hypothetical protein
LAYAGFWWRVLGYLLDGLIVGIPYGVVVEILVLQPMLNWLINQVNQLGPGGVPVLTPNEFWQIVPVANLVLAGVVGAVLYALYFGVAVSVWGRTVGQLAVRARVVRREDLTRRLPLGRALARSAVFWLTPISSVIPFSLGSAFWPASLVGYAVSLLVFLALLWVAWDPQKQGLHDKLGRALVLRDPPAPVPVAYIPPPYPYPYPYPYPPPGAPQPQPQPGAPGQPPATSGQPPATPDQAPSTPAAP